MSDDTERERLLARWATEPRFHALMKTLEGAASRGEKLEVLESLRMGEQILPVGSVVLDRTLAHEIAAVLVGFSTDRDTDATRARRGQVAALLRGETR